ncbi:MAG: hypothetical protein AAFQ07_14850 [Chloroflexota bacterium]
MLEHNLAYSQIFTKMNKDVDSTIFMWFCIEIHKLALCAGARVWFNMARMHTRINDLDDRFTL